jgi:acetyl esterase
MSLHPQAVEFLGYTAGQPKLHTLTPEQARVQLEGVPAAIGPGPAVESVHDVLIRVSDGEVPARIYEPKGLGATVVWFHGGLWVFGGLDSHDAMCRRLANSSGCRLISVAYRLAPEHKFPVPLEDCWAAIAWAASEYPAQPLVIGGDSAGGNLAAVCAVRARELGGPDLALQVLVYPMTDAAMDTPSMTEHGGDQLLLLGRRDVAWSYAHYLSDGVDPMNPEVSPLRTPELSDLPPAIVVTDEYDPLRDEGLAYATRLRDAGVSVSEHHYSDMMHVFFQLVNVLEGGNRAVDQVGSEIKYAIAGLSEVSASSI